MAASLVRHQRLDAVGEVVSVSVSRRFPIVLVVVVVLGCFSGWCERSSCHLLSPCIPLPSWQTASIPAEYDDEDEDEQDWKSAHPGFPRCLAYGVCSLHIWRGFHFGVIYGHEDSAQGFNPGKYSITRFALKWRELTWANSFYACVLPRLICRPFRAHRSG
jgi:hypothetical protein